MITTLMGLLRSGWSATRGFARAHKFWSTVIALVVLWGGYQGYARLTAPSTATRYVTTTVATGTVVATLTETGQVSASQTLTLSPKASGQVVGVYVRPGDRVAAGQVVAQLDATDALQSLANAKLALAHQQLSYEQTTATSTLQLNLLQAQNAVTNAETALQKTHDASYATLANIYSDLSSITSDLDSVLHDSNVAGRTNQQNIDAYADIVSSNDLSIGIYKSAAETSYTAAVAAYQSALATYKATPMSVSDDALVSLAGTTYTAVQAAAQAVKDAHDFFDRIQSDYTAYNLATPSALTSLLAKVDTDTTTVTSDLSSALTTKSDIVSAEQTLAVAKNTLQATEGGSNTLTVQSAAISLQQAEQAVTSAEQTVADYSVVAPFAGTIASVGVQKYDQAGSGTSVATLVTANQQVDLTVNEVDASKIKVGQQVSVTFDALPDVTLAGTVATVDSVGSVSQGVVSYDVTVALATQNASVKPGMSATASIITDTATGLVVPASAIKAAGTESYVEVFDPPLAGSETNGGAASAAAPQRVMVTTGLSDDTSTIVTGGLSAGADVVTQTIAGTASAPSAAPRTFGGGGGTFRAAGGAAGGAVFRGGGG